MSMVMSSHALTVGLKFQIMEIQLVLDFLVTIIGKILLRAYPPIIHSIFVHF